MVGQRAVLSMRWRRAWLIGLLILTVAAFLVSRSLDYVISLPGNYFLVRANASDLRVINEQKGIWIGPTVDRYQVVGKFVVGHVTRLDREVGFRKPGPSGHFVVNTATDQVWEGLTEENWRAVLRQLGITEEPKLKQPSRYDRSYAGQ